MCFAHGRAQCEAQQVSTDDLHHFAAYNFLLTWSIEFYELLVCDRPLKELEPRRQIVVKIPGTTPITMWPVYKSAGVKVSASATMRYLGIHDGTGDESANYDEKHEAPKHNAWLDSILKLRAEFEEQELLFGTGVG